MKWQEKKRYWYKICCSHPNCQSLSCDCDTKWKYSIHSVQVKLRKGADEFHQLYFSLSSPWSPASRKCPPIRLFNVVWRGNEFWKIAGAICQDVMLRQLIWGMVKTAWENRRGTAGEGRPVTAQTQLGGVVGEGRNWLFTHFLPTKALMQWNRGKPIYQDLSCSLENSWQIWECVWMQGEERETCFSWMGGGSCPPHPGACQLFGGLILNKGLVLFWKKDAFIFRLLLNVGLPLFQENIEAMFKSDSAEHCVLESGKALFNFTSQGLSHVHMMPLCWVFFNSIWV